MSLSITQSKTALAAGLKASFLGIGGTPAYVYSVLAGGAGGSIDSGTGLYTAPTIINSDPSKAYDTIQVLDGAAATATSQILVGTPLILFCEILQRELSLDNAHIYLWDQKIFQPKDSDLYIVIGVHDEKVFGNNTGPGMIGDDVDWSVSFQRVNVMAVLDLDLISRGPAARDRKEEVIMALNSVYAEKQQESNSFAIGRIPPGARFQNLSLIDGAAIPYRFRISVNMQYTVTKTKSVDYFDVFDSEEITTNP